MLLQGAGLKYLQFCFIRLVLNWDFLTCFFLFSVLFVCLLLLFFYYHLSSCLEFRHLCISHLRVGYCGIQHWPLHFGATFNDIKLGSRIQGHQNILEAEWDFCSWLQIRSEGGRGGGCSSWVGTAFAPLFGVMQCWLCLPVGKVT